MIDPERLRTSKDNFGSHTAKIRLTVVDEPFMICAEQIFTIAEQLSVFHCAVEQSDYACALLRTRALSSLSPKAVSLHPASIFCSHTRHIQSSVSHPTRSRIQVEGTLTE